MFIAIITLLVNNECSTSANSGSIGDTRQSLNNDSNLDYTTFEDADVKKKEREDLLSEIHEIKKEKAAEIRQMRGACKSKNLDQFPIDLSFFFDFYDHLVKGFPYVWTQPKEGFEKSLEFHINHFKETKELFTSFKKLAEEKNKVFFKFVIDFLDYFIDELDESVYFSYNYVFIENFKEENNAIRLEEN